MLALYHAGVSVCAAKVLISLSEKQLAWESRPLNFMAGDQTSPEYLKLNPNGVVPTLIHDDRVIIESTVINEYLEDICPVPALRPDTAYGRAQMRIWTKREDQFHEAINTITMAIVFRPTLLAAPEAVREARMDGSPDRGRREKWRRVMADGLHASDVRLALLRFAKDLRDMDKALAGRPWLAGDDFTLADVGLVPYVERLRVLHLDFMWDDKPHLAGWFERCKARPSVQEGLGNGATPGALAPYDQFGPIARPVVQGIWADIH